MPGRTEAFEVLLDFTNDTHDAATVQLLRDYGRSTSTVVLLHPGESVTLVLDAGMLLSPDVHLSLPYMQPRRHLSICTEDTVKSCQRYVRGHRLRPVY